MMMMMMKKQSNLATLFVASWKPLPISSFPLIFLKSRSIATWTACHIYWSCHVMLCAHTSRSISSSSPLSNPHLCTDEDPEGRFFWTRICLTPLEGLQLSLDSPGPQGGACDGFPNLYQSLFSMATNASIRSQGFFSETCPKITIPVIYLCVYSFIYWANIY